MYGTAVGVVAYGRYKLVENLNYQGYIVQKDFWLYLGGMT